MTWNGVVGIVREKLGWCFGTMGLASVGFTLWYMNLRYARHPERVKILRPANLAMRLR